ncbi:MAG TPA: arginine deiminase family protein, partial [Thermoplasmata archaeon]|nr:arginine deiminase family protein [Thermoplasmata archaeon]
MATAFGSQSMVDPLRMCLVRRPGYSFAVDDPEPWGYTSKPNLTRSQEEHDAFVAMLRESRVDVRLHNEPLPGKADSIFVHDPAIVTDEGAILLRMGKELRRGEEAAIGLAFEKLGVPVLATLRAPATAEGGDLVWLDHDTLAIGRGFRTNEAGLMQ